MRENRLQEINELIYNSVNYSDIPIRESYYLNNWYRYKVNLKEMNKLELDNARTLFKALKELSLEDRSFLANKYDRPTVPNGKNRVHPSDKVVAGELGMEAKEYRKQRREVQQRLKVIMQKQADPDKYLRS